jgi:hypothetical protein
VSGGELRYSIDTSALLDGWVRYYPPDVFPGLWQQLDGVITEGRLIATEEVLFELERKDDTVYAWAKERRSMFIPIDDRIQPRVTDVLDRFEKLLDTRANRSGGDPFVIALAMVEGCTVVSGERATGATNRPNIPDVCSELSVPCITLLQLIRNEGWVFTR